MSAEPDYFTDPEVLLDPYAFFESIRARGPVAQLEARDMVLITGHQEALDVLRNADDFSSATVLGPTVDLPFTPVGDDISDQIEAHRATLEGPSLMVAYDGVRHSQARGLLNKLFVPSRLKANEAFIHSFAKELAAEMVTKGKCEVINEVATPFVTLVIADLLGVPPEDREKFRAAIDNGPTAGDINETGEVQATSALIFMGGFFMEYITDRRANPRADVLTELATATYPDGSTPELLELVKASVFLFAAGQDTSAKLIGNALRFLCEDMVLQERLRADLSLIPQFVEEMLRIEGSTKTTFRLASRTTKVGDVTIPAGTRVVVSLAAANRDPRRWDAPTELKLGRPKAMEHLAFGRGAHVCAGAPLARVEVRVMLEELLKQTKAIRLSEAHHGPTEARSFAYQPSYIIRGLNDLHIELDAR